MLLIVNKMISFALILFVKYVLSDEKQNIFNLYNESDFIELIRNSSLNVSSNISDTKLVGQTNGRMRSFLAEEEEESQVIPQKFFEFQNKTNINNSLQFSEQLNEDMRNTYSYPIFNYQINSENINKPEKEYIFPAFNLSNMTYIQKQKRPRYRFKNNSKHIQTRNSFLQSFKYFENFDNFSSVANMNMNMNMNMVNSNESSNSNNYNNINNIVENNTETNETLKSKPFINDIKVEKESESFVTQKWSKSSQLHNTSEKFCVSSTDCDTELNERCIDRNKYSICGCKEPFFREDVSQKCQIKKLIRLLFKVSSIDSKQINSNSLEFIQMKYSIERNIWSVVINSSHLLTIVDNIKVIELIDSKIVVDFYVKIANPSNNFHHKYNEYHFWYLLMSSIKGIDLNEYSLNSFDLRAVEIVDDIDYCSVKELNYCSDSAICIDNKESDGKFECKCKSGLTDLSPNINFKGEICALKCTSDLCGTGGVCEIRNHTEIHCICTDWKFGDRCQYSLYAFLSVGALFIIISIFFSVCLATLYCGYKIHQEFDKLRIQIQQNHLNGENSLPLI